MRDININMTGWQFLVPNIELCGGFDASVRGPLDAPDWISAGAAGGSMILDGGAVLPPMPLSINREDA